MNYFTHAFEAEISLHGVGKSRVITYKVLFLPPHLVQDLPFDQFPRLRVEGEIADVPVRGAWMPVGDDRRYFIVSPDVKKNTGLDVGDLVEMRFRIDDQDYVDVPSSLQSAIDADQKTRMRWDALSAGKKRMFAFHVLSAKSAATEAKRVSEAKWAIDHEISLRDLQNRKTKKE